MMTREEALQRVEQIKKRERPGAAGCRHEKFPDGSERIVEIKSVGGEEVIYERA